jgi:hypothetical protein
MGPVPQACSPLAAFASAGGQCGWPVNALRCADQRRKRPSALTDEAKAGDCPPNRLSRCLPQTSRHRFTVRVASPSRGSAAASVVRHQPATHERRWRNAAERSENGTTSRAFRDHRNRPAAAARLLRRACSAGSSTPAAQSQTPSPNRPTTGSWTRREPATGSESQVASAEAPDTTLEPCST